MRAMISSNYVKTVMPEFRDVRILPFSPDDMFALVADIEKYPEFLPWCAGLRITGEKRASAPQIISAEMIIAYKMFREQFSCNVVLDREKREILIEYLAGPMKNLHTRWQFANVPGGCEVDFSVSLEMKNKLLQSLIWHKCGKVSERMISAFEKRAEDICPPMPKA